MYQQNVKPTHEFVQNGNFVRKAGFVKDIVSHCKKTLLEVPDMPKSMKGWSQTDAKKAFEKVMQNVAKTKAKRSQNRAETGSEKGPGRKSVQDATTSIY